jgi:hypothetical protein
MGGFKSIGLNVRMVGATDADMGRDLKKVSVIGFGAASLGAFPPPIPVAKYNAETHALMSKQNPC